MPYSVPTAIPPRKSLGPNLRLNHHSTRWEGIDRRERIGDIKAGPRAPEPTSLFAPARKYQLDLARALIDEGDLLLDNDIAESAHLRPQLVVVQPYSISAAANVGEETASAREDRPDDMLHKSTSGRILLRPGDQACSEYGAGAGLYRPADRGLRRLSQAGHRQQTHCPG